MNVYLDFVGGAYYIHCIDAPQRHANCDPNQYSNEFYI